MDCWGQTETLKMFAWLVMNLMMAPRLMMAMSRIFLLLHTSGAGVFRFEVMTLL